MFLLFGVAAAITGFVTLCLLFFQSTRKTYPGFGYWTTGVFFLALGYLLYALRGQIPFHITVFLGNFAFSLGMVLHLDGIRRFLGLKPASRFWYALPAAVLAGLAVFYFQWDLPTWRNLVAAAPLAAIHWTMAALLFRSADSIRSTLYHVIGSLLGFGGFLLLVRAVWLIWVPNPDLLFKAPMEFAFFTSFVLLHLGENLSLIMLNAERVESELMDAKDALAGTVTGLEEALTRRKQIEESLRDSEEKYRNFFDTSRDAVFMTTRDGKLIDFNEVALEMLGYEHSQREEVLGKRVSDLYVNSEEREEHAATVAKIGFSKDYPVDFWKRDGTVVHTLITTVVRKDSQGSFMGFQGTIRDITESMKVEESLRAKTLELAERVKELNCLFGISEVVQKHGSSPEAILERIIELIPPSLPQPEVTCARIILGDQEFRSENWGPPLSQTSSEIIVHGMTIGVLEVGRLGEVPDGTRQQFFKEEPRLVSEIAKRVGQIVERIRDGEMLRREKEFTETALNSQRDTFFLFEAVGGRAIRWNKAFRDISGYSDEEIAVMRAPDSYYGTEELIRARSRIQEILEKGSGTLELELICKDGGKIPFEYGASVFKYLDDAPAFLISIGRDIRDRKRAEAESEILRKQLFQAQKMEAIGTLTGGIAHDFNNLFTIINGYAELLLSEKTEDDPMCTDLLKVLETGRKGAQLVHKLLALSKKGQSNPQLLDVNRQVESSVAVMKRTFSKMIEIETILENKLPRINADAEQVDQMILNLCINAGDAMSDGGKLSIKTKNVILDEADCKFHMAAKPGRYLRMEISDTGVGMSRETMERMFDPFFTTKGWDFNKGTGLGLSVAKGIVEHHGGWITCRSEPGKGTTFRVFFPAAVEEAQSDRLVHEPETLPGEKILLIDDEEYVTDLGKRILERAGYEVITASDGKEALDIYAGQQSTIGLVIIDLIMPQMSGEQCLKQLCKMNPNVKVVVSSGHPLDGNERDRLGAYAKAFVGKPYEVKQLVQAVRAVMRPGSYDGSPPGTLGN